MHYIWASKALSSGYHVIVDKPLCKNLKQIKNLIKLSIKKKKLISEAIFFNYHNQIKNNSGMTLEIGFDNSFNIPENSAIFNIMPPLQYSISLGRYNRINFTRKPFNLHEHGFLSFPATHQRLDR